ncbi:hypothetical protein BC629DRAFT_508168 [Irpex lacteus]|nr:hypothetical protein BC629DRAFT_508168 [Irpex lacteus]
MLWDMFINIGDEIECIWARPTTWVKFAYGFLRYAPILQCIANVILELHVEDDFTSPFCKHYMIEKYTIMLLVIIVVQTVYILFYEQKVALPILTILFGAEVIVMATTLGLVIRKLTFNPNCVVVGSLPTSNIVFWLAALGFEFLLFICNLVKFRFHRQASLTFGMPERLARFSKEGLWASAFILAALLLSTVIHQLSNLSADGVGYNWTIAVISCTGANILLNLRKFANALSSNEFTCTWPSFLSHNQICERV